MKIAIVFPRLSGPYGGEKILIQVSDELVRLGHKITLYVYQYNKICGKYLNPEIRVSAVGALTFGKHNLDTFLAYLSMPYLASKVKGEYDLILGMTWQSAFALWWIKKFRKRFRTTPLIYHCFEPPRFIYDLQTVTGNSILARMIAPLIKWLDKISVQSVREIISISDDIQKQVKQIYGRDSFKVYPGVEIERFQKYTKSEARKSLGIPEGQEVFLSISKLHRRKRLDQALKIFLKKRRNKSSVFFIAGRGPEEDRLRAQARRMKLEWTVKFIGVVLGDKTVQYMAACDYFIFTALNEPFGIAPLEAKVAGAKVIPKERPYPIISWRESVGELNKIFLIGRSSLLTGG